ncbi:MAG: hypothetical protein Kow0068_19500 [Marinilabiliales bacterium]
MKNKLYIIGIIVSLLTVNGYSQFVVTNNNSFLRTENEKTVLNNLQAKYYNNLVYLKWTSSTTPEDCFFIIQKSYDGNNFETIGFKKIYGDTVKVNLLYCFKDTLKSESNAQVYYRIAKPVDNEELLYSNIVEINQSALQLAGNKELAINK